MRRAFADAFDQPVEQRATALRTAVQDCLADQRSDQQLEMVSQWIEANGGSGGDEREVSEASRPSEAMLLASQRAVERLAMSLLGRPMTSATELEAFIDRIRIVADVMFEWLPKLLAVRQEQKQEFSVDTTNIHPQRMDAGSARLQQDAANLREELLVPRPDQTADAIRERLTNSFGGLVEHPSRLHARHGLRDAQGAGAGVTRICARGSDRQAWRCFGMGRQEICALAGLLRVT